MDFLEDQVAEEDEYQQDASILVLALAFLARHHQNSGRRKPEIQINQQLPQPDP